MRSRTPDQPRTPGRPKFGIWPWQYIFGKPWTISCGGCDRTWRERLPVPAEIVRDRQGPSHHRIARIEPGRGTGQARSTGVTRPGPLRSPQRAVQRDLAVRGTRGSHPARDRHTAPPQPDNQDSDSSSRPRRADIGVRQPREGRRKEHRENLHNSCHRLRQS